jgi:antitoxin CcdA
MRMKAELITMYPVYNHDAPKRPTNLSINSDLLLKARDFKINLSATLESALEEQVRRSERDKWQKENRKTIALLNDYTEANGLFSDSYRDL